MYIWPSWVFKLRENDTCIVFNKSFRKKGYSLGTIKHAHHNFDIDKPGKDSWKHREAGSQEIIVSSSKRIGTSLSMIMIKIPI